MFIKSPNSSIWSKILSTLILLSLVCLNHIAQAYPNGPVKLVIPASAGGTTDILARLIAKPLSDAWQVPVIVENRVGAGGVIGAKFVIDSKPDGQTVLIAPSALGVRSGIDKKLPYDSVKELAGVSLIGLTPSFLIVSNDPGVTTLQQLANRAKGSKEKIFYASAGIGSTAHLHAALFAKNYGFEAVHVAYKGTPEAVIDTIAGRVTYVFAPGPNALPLAKDGKAKILGTTSKEGQIFASTLNPMPELIRDDIGDDWFASFVPTGTPKIMRDKLSNEITRILKLPEIQDSFTQIGAIGRSSTPEQLDDMYSKYVAKAAKIAKEANISAE